MGKTGRKRVWKYGVREVAALVGLAPWTVRKHIREGRLKMDLGGVTEYIGRMKR